MEDKTRKFERTLVFAVVAALIIVSVALALIAITADSEMTPNNTVQTPAEEISSFEECADAGYPVLESYPAQCAVPGGGTFVQELPPEEQNPAPEEPTGFDARDEMNSIIVAAGSPPITDWQAGPSCGPTDEFLGSYLIFGNLNIAEATTSLLITELEKEGFYQLVNIQDNGNRTTLERDNVRVNIAYSDNLAFVYVTISNLDEVPADLLDNQIFCG